jgi:hypothetical protein
MEAQRQFSPRSDPRHSGGTAYSEQTINTNKTHSRGASSVSTAPSLTNQYASLRGGDTPVKYSSMANPSQSASLAVSSPALQPNENVRFSMMSRISLSEDSDISAAIIASADAAYGYSPTDVPSPMRITPRTPGPAPTRKLPALPDGSDDTRSILNRRRSAKSIQTSVSSPALHTHLGISSPTPSEASLRESIRSTQSLRQQKVKALRSRDMAALRNTAGLAKRKEDNIIESPPSTAKVRSSNSSGRQGHRRTQSASSSKQNVTRWGSSITMSPIMLVADLEPCSDKFRTGPLAAPCRRLHSARPSSSTASMINDNQTPPRSPTPSYPSSDEEDFFSSTIHGPRPPTSTKAAPHRTQEQGRPLRSKLPKPVSSATTRESELERRLANIEASNALLLQTLTTALQMGTGIRELKTFLPIVNNGLKPLTSGRVDKGTGEIEPLARELQKVIRINSNEKKASLRIGIF